MQTITQVIDGQVLGQVISLPKDLQNTTLKITIVPAVPIAPAKQEKSPKLTRAMLKEMLKGSDIEAITGILKDAGDIDLKEMQAERRMKKYGCTD